ncbi:hypothetical protein R3P38DRAFT_3153832 [Favolaschia claudopus]|uniref:Uncharacterized protein n=1 Tax=Favolaschia claudopus TaxID=2862362 RepID=A0AAV9Z1R4_9AGAR
MEGGMGHHRRWRVYWRCGEDGVGQSILISAHPPTDTLGEHPSAAPALLLSPGTPRPPPSILRGRPLCCRPRRCEFRMAGSSLQPTSPGAVSSVVSMAGIVSSVRTESKPRRRRKLKSFAGVTEWRSQGSGRRGWWSGSGCSGVRVERMRREESAYERENRKPTLGCGEYGGGVFPVAGSGWRRRRDDAEGGSEEERERFIPLGAIQPHGVASRQAILPRPSTSNPPLPAFSYPRPPSLPLPLPDPLTHPRPLPPRQ